MKLIADTHTHTTASGHALSTVRENAAEARKKGLFFLSISDHASSMEAAPKEIYFSTLPHVLPRCDSGVFLLSSCEANILDHYGSLDLLETTLEKLDLVIASMHILCFTPETKDKHTQAWICACHNPHVDILGHLGDDRYSFDQEAVVQCCRATGTIIEINSHSFSARPGSQVNCRNIALLCKKYEVPIVVSSDAHYAASVGDFSDAVTMLNSIAFPEELVLNASYHRFAEYLKSKTGKSFDPELIGMERDIP